MITLAIDTSGPFASAALSRGGKVTHEINACHGLTHSQTAMRLVDDALAAAGLEIGQVDLFACVAGPGSFTGVRIGVCEAKAFAHACQKPVIGVDALEALAMNAFGFSGVICPILDARRGQVYCAAFRFEEGKLPVRLRPDRALPLAEFLGDLPADERLMFLGDGLDVHFPAARAALGERALAAPANMAYLRASSVCALAEARVSEAVDYMSLQPIYLRAPQAERERAEREACRKQ